MLYLLLFLVGFLTDVCQCCETGYYSSNGECQTCPNNCASCSSASSCTSCNAGYYGGICAEYCPVYCHYSECNQISGQCLSCKEGYYNDKNKSCSRCPENCATCNSKHFCFTCRSGYKGEYCQSVCSKCKPGTSCDKHSGYCQSDCMDGFSGELCDTPCNSKCESCDRYKPYECISCAPDRYGPSCNEPCSRTCDLNMCDVRIGNCTSGCIDGFWGERCEKICSSQCNNQVCYQNNGKCVDGCIAEFDGIDCSTISEKSSKSLTQIIGVSLGAVVGVCVLAVIIWIFWKRYYKHETECTMDGNEDTNMMLPLAQENAYVKEDISKFKVANASIESGPQHELNYHADNNTSEMLKTSDEKHEENEALKPANHEEKNKGHADSESDAFLTDSPITDRERTDHRNMAIARFSTKPIGERAVAINNDNQDNVNLEEEMKSRTSIYGSTSMAKNKTDPNTPEKKDVANTFLRRGTEYCSNSRERLNLNVPHTVINDNAACKPIQVTRLAHYVANKDNAAYLNEFLELSNDTNFTNGQQKSPSCDNKLQTNIPKIGLPIVLKDEAAAKINAYFINGGPFELKAYVSYMGPSIMTPASKRAFWKTVMQERCSTIVMLTTHALPEEKCTCIFKNIRCYERFGDIMLECNGETNHGSFTSRKYTIKKQMMVRVVQRLHFTKPTYGVPDYASSFVDFVKHTNKVKPINDEPTMVYCSSGTERTGTYIALDILTRQGVDRGFVDIFGCVRDLRKQRVNMIHNCEQYEFLHKALAITFTSNDGHEVEKGTPV